MKDEDGSGNVRLNERLGGAKPKWAERNEQEDAIYNLERKVDDMAMLIRQLVHQIHKTNPDNKTAERAVDYLKRNNLQGSILR